MEKINKTLHNNKNLSQGALSVDVKALLAADKWWWALPAFTRACYAASIETEVTLHTLHRLYTQHADTK